MHQRFHRQHLGHGQHLGRHPDVRIHLELHPVHRLERRHLGERSLHQPDVVRLRSRLGVERRRHLERHLGDLGRLGDLRHQQDVGRLGDPFLVMVRTGCCQGG
jgi:hypothetical protein